MFISVKCCTVSIKKHILMWCLLSSSYLVLYTWIPEKNYLTADCSGLNVFSFFSLSHSKRRFSCVSECASYPSYSNCIRSICIAFGEFSMRCRWCCFFSSLTTLIRSCTIIMWTFVPWIKCVCVCEKERQSKMRVPFHCIFVCGVVRATRYVFFSSFFSLLEMVVLR